MKKHIYLILQLCILGIYLVISCKKEEKKKTNNQAEAKSVVLDNNVDSINVFKDEFYPNDSLFTLKFLNIGEFHEDEVWENASKEKWFGIFGNKDGFYIAETPIKTSRVNDPIVDEENEITGWKVDVETKDSCYFLVQKNEMIMPIKFQKVDFKEKYIAPGKKYAFKYLGIEYELSAKGKSKFDESVNSNIVTDYQLFLSAKIDGKPKKSLLVFQKYSDAKEVELILGGDFDGDGILDLIIDTSHHYNNYNPKLYLSKAAEQNEILKPIANHSTVGC